MDLGAKKADLAHDLARKYITIDDPQKQQALQQIWPVKKATQLKNADEVEADKAFVAVLEVLQVGERRGPRVSARTRQEGPRIIEMPPVPCYWTRPLQAAGGCLIMKGINSTKDDRPLVPKLVPKSKSGKTSTDGFINFKLKARGVSGTLRLKVASSKDHQNNSILVGNLRIKEGETEWVENIRAFRAAADTDDWPEELPRPPLDVPSYWRGTSTYPKHATCLSGSAPASSIRALSVITYSRPPRTATRLKSCCCPATTRYYRPARSTPGRYCHGSPWRARRP